MLYEGRWMDEKVYFIYRCDIFRVTKLGMVLDRFLFVLI